MGRLLQISQQHIESQLDRVRHERELWKEVVDKRSQQPLQLALTLKDQNTGMPLGGAGAAAYGGMTQGGFAPATQVPAGMMAPSGLPMGPQGSVPLGSGESSAAMKPSPLAK